MRKLTIQFDGKEICDHFSVIGFESSKEMLLAVSRGKIDSDCIYFEFKRNGEDEVSGEVTGVRFIEAKVKPGDILFDYESGTRWKVVEAK